MQSVLPAVRLVPPAAAEEIAAPAQEGIRLDNGQSPLPDAIGAGELRAFDLTGDDDELLTQQGVFGDQIQARAGEIPDRAGQEADSERLGSASWQLTEAAGDTLDGGADRANHALVTL